MSLTYDDQLDQKPGETVGEWRRRLEEVSKTRADYAPGGYMSTRNEDGGSRGGAASMFEQYGFF